MEYMTKNSSSKTEAITTKVVHKQCYGQQGHNFELSVFMFALACSYNYYSLEFYMLALLPRYYSAVIGHSPEMCQDTFHWGGGDFMISPATVTKTKMPSKNCRQLSSSMADFFD